jgi:hypothetical protein
MSEFLSAQTLTDGLTPIVAFTYPTEADRLADTNRTPSTIALAVDKVCRQVDTGDLYRWDGAAWQSLTAGTYGISLVTGSSATRYTTIAAALAAASSGDVVKLGPGTYAESITVPSGVVLKCDAGAAHITGVLATGSRVTMSGDAVLDGIKVTLPTDALPAISYTGSGIATVRDVSLVGAGASGIGVRMSGSGTLVLDRVQYVSGTADMAVEQTAGIVEAHEIFILGGTLSDAVSVTGGEFEFANFVVGLSASVTHGLHVGAGEVDGSVGTIRGTSAAVHIASDSAEVKLRALRLKGDTYDLLVDPALTSGTCYLQSVRATESKLSTPAAWVGGADYMYELLDATPGALSIRMHAELHLGIAEKGRELVAGRGDSTVRAQVVLTSDSTATSTTEGGNLTDVSAAASSFSGSTFSFQGTDANHTIMVCQNLLDAAALTKLKHWGWKLLQTTGGSIGGAYAFELWDGAAWTAFDVMASEATDFYRYANDVFVRPNSTEHIRFGIDNTTTWASKAINGTTGYWTRVRITSAPATAPVWQQCKVSTPRFEANENGVVTVHGLAQWRQTISATGNVFGETGGVVDADIAVGNGGVPTGWTHNMKNSRMNNNADAIYMQFGLPRGICTAFPLRFDINYGIVGTGTDPPAMILSVLPQEVSGTLAASGTAIVPVPRTDANTDTLIVNAAQTDSFTLPETSDGKIHKTSRDGFSIASIYEGDNVLVRLEMDDDGTDNLDVAIWEIEVSGVVWTHGERL